MKKVIAVDIDDVLLESANAIVSHYNAVYQTSIDLSAIYSRNPEVWGVSDIGIALGRLNKYLESEEFFKLPPTKESVEALGKLSSHRLYAVTGRHGAMEVATKEWLEQFFPSTFEDIILTGFFNVGEAARSKASICREIGADVLVDDNLSHALGVAKEGIDVLLFGNYPWNQAEVLPPNVVRVPGWKEAVKILVNAGS